MPLDVTVSPQTVTSTLHYLKRGAEKPTRYVAEPPPGVPAWNGIDDPREMTIEDARGRETEFTIDRNGFQLVKAPTWFGISTQTKRSSASTTQKSSVCCATFWGRAACSCLITVCAMPDGLDRKS